jgi:hypothetical protein
MECSNFAAVLKNLFRAVVKQKIRRNLRLPQRQSFIPAGTVLTIVIDHADGTGFVQRMEVDVKSAPKSRLSPR